jgi:hypothetical protein
MALRIGRRRYKRRKCWTVEWKTVKVVEKEKGRGELRRQERGI